MPRAGLLHCAAYSGFSYGQGDRCRQPAGSCLRFQVDDLYTEDAAREATGVRGHYFLSSWRQGGSYFVNLADTRLSFATDRFQRSLVAIHLDAASVRYVLKVAPAVIVAVSIPRFEALSRNGQATVDVRNTGTIRSSYMVALACTGDAVLPVAAVPVTLEAGAAGRVWFSLLLASTSAGAYPCSVTLTDALGRDVDQRRVIVNVTSTAFSAGEQAGSPAPDAPAVSRGSGNGTDAATPCSACGTFELTCRLRPTCIVAWAAGLSAGLLAAVGALVWLALAAKYPALACAPCLAAGRLASLLCANRGGAAGGASNGTSGGPSTAGKGASDAPPAAPHRDRRMSTLESSVAAMTAALTALLAQQQRATTTPMHAQPPDNATRTDVGRPHVVMNPLRERPPAPTPPPEDGAVAAASPLATREAHAAMPPPRDRGDVQLRSGGCGAPLPTALRTPPLPTAAPEVSPLASSVGFAAGSPVWKVNAAQPSGRVVGWR